MSDRNAKSAELGAGISRSLVLLLAITCGAAVADLYYAQPLLQTISHAFSVSDGTAGFLVTFTQAGYVVGLALLVPLGDLLERRTLIATMLLIAAAGLAVAAAAPGFAVFALAVGALGFTAVVAQIVVAMSSSLAGEHERGRVVGTVMSGLLIGILTARIVSGLVAQLFGWRVIFVLAAVAMVLLAAVVRLTLPRVPATERLSYPQLLRSVVELVQREPLLRQRMLIGATALGCFSILWTSVAFMLSGAPYHYGNAAIGLFGIAFSGGVALSAATSALYSSGGWGAVCALGAGTAALGLLTWLVTERVMTGRLPIGADSAAC